ncbi:ABC transporter permease [Streptomyces paludis]|uniref:ABC transporter permease n=1 Tax=Streptomyces paludis TaxID=2282738 RepID=A0A345HPA5_9ACTN|nr:ABC transporter permease [Streptomyces paludis]AXG78529.1 ABC transporter permease [Streptomyces paludis]
MGVLGEAWTWLATAGHWVGDGGVWHRLQEHVTVSATALLIACAIALPVAFFLGHLGRGGAVAINISNVGRAVPVFAVLALFMVSPLRNSGSVPTVIALVLFAVPPLLTNAYVGMAEVDRAVVEAARGMGMSGWQLFLRVELPLAHPLVMTGLRSASVQVVATATIAAMVGQGGLGRIITAGFNTYNTPQVVAGALLVALLALLVEGALLLLDRLIGPAAARRAPAAGAPAAPARKDPAAQDPARKDPARTTA